MNQGMWVASSSWKRKGKKWSLKASRKESSPVDTLILPSETHIELLTYKI